MIRVFLALIIAVIAMGCGQSAADKDPMNENVQPPAAPPPPGAGGS